MFSKYLLIVFLVFAGLLGTARELYAGEETSRSPAANWLVKIAKEMYEEGRETEALREFQKVLLVDPRHPEARRYVEILTSRESSMEATLDQLERAFWQRRRDVQVSRTLEESVGSERSPGREREPGEETVPAPPQTRRPVTPRTVGPSPVQRPREQKPLAREAQPSPRVAVSERRRKTTPQESWVRARESAMDDAMTRRTSPEVVSAPPQPIDRSILRPRKPKPPVEPGEEPIREEPITVAAQPSRAAARGAPVRVSPGGVQVLLDDEPVSLERPVLLEGNEPQIPLRGVAAALGYSVISLGGGQVELISPEGEIKRVTLALPEPELLATREELSEHFNLRTRYDQVARTVHFWRFSPVAFRTFTIPKSEEALREEAAQRELIERVAASLEEPSGIPEAARPSVETTGSVTYTYENPHAGPLFRTLTTTLRGRAYGYDLAFESARKDENGSFEHDFTFLNLSKPGLFLGFFDQNVDLMPLRSQFANFNGMTVTKTWGTPGSVVGQGGGTAPRFRGLSPRERGLATTLSWGETETAVSGRDGAVTYLGDLFEARQEWTPTDRLSLEGAMLYMQNDANFLESVGTSDFPRRNLVWFGNAGYDLTENLALSGQVARANYEPDDNPNSSISDWNWRTGLDWKTSRSSVRAAYEFVGKNYASIGNPATYQDFQGVRLLGTHRLTDRWSVSGSFRRFRDNVNDDPSDRTTQNQAVTLATSFRPAANQSLSLRYTNTVANPSGPGGGSSSRSQAYGVDYSHPFLLGTRLLSTYEYFQTVAPVASDSRSHAAGLTLFKSYGQGSNWNATQRIRRTDRQDQDDGLNLNTSMNWNHHFTPNLHAFTNASYTRDLDDVTENDDSVSASLGLRYETKYDTTLGVEYSIGPYDLDAEKDKWPRSWSIRFLATKRFGFSTPPNFGMIDGRVFQDLNANGRQDPGEPGVEAVSVELGETRRKMVTDSQGQFLFSRVVPDTHELHFDLSNLDPVWTAEELRPKVRVRNRKATDVLVPLVQGGLIRGIVFIDENEDFRFQDIEEPLEGVAVILLPNEDFRRTDPDGTFAFDYLVPGRYTLQIHMQDLPDGYELASEETLEVVVGSGEELRDMGFAVRLAVPVQEF